ncbi:MAG: hypothetical protein KF760_28420 [Candidatus Eremiobacteraeota bacterium]|nr:hypothetical protein [Candidatus Eremiobacteraeota bacterium]MCW5865822.1 hypothetical protein [Candidatus Eremiobacteraeota bacterium]
MKNRFAALLLAVGLFNQLHSLCLETYEPVLPALKVAEPASPLGVVPIAQQTGYSDGQATVAMAINCLTGKNLDENDIDKKYGYELLSALREECASAGLNWQDGGEIGPDKWEMIEHKILNEKLPVVLALNGPEFSVDPRRGHIVLVCGLEGDKVTYADPATGTLRTTTRSNINNALQHPQGNFIFYADRELDIR